MAQEVAILKWCDVHLQEKDERKEGQSLTLNGKEMELCTDCAQGTSLYDAYPLFERYGHRPSMEKRVFKSPTGKRVVPNGSPELTKDEEETLICRFRGTQYALHTCKKPKESTQGVKQHLSRNHLAELETWGHENEETV